MNNQEIFDKVVTHLLTQNEQSLKDGQCYYRTEEGLSCAVGCLIPDKLYNSDIEGIGLTPPYASLINGLGPVLKEAGIGKDSYVLLDRLQELHDCNEPSTWMVKILRIARQFNLEYKGLSQ